jgi:polar amino acid transport system substrate-binding protein
MNDLRGFFAPTGTLRAAINMGNAVLAHSHTASEKPAGVTIDLSRDLARVLGVSVALVCFEGAGKAGAALAAEQVDVGFMAIDPLRAQELLFTRPYVQIEGCYAVQADSPLTDNAQVDCEGVRVIVGQASAYALHLQRHLQRAQLVDVPTSEEVVQTMLQDSTHPVAAGVRQQLEADAARFGGVRLLPGRFMVIEQAMAMSRARAKVHAHLQAAAFLENFIEERRSQGYVAEALQRHGMTGATVVTS